MRVTATPRTWALAYLWWAAACFDPTDTPSPGDGGSSGTPGSSGSSGTVDATSSVSAAESSTSATATATTEGADTSGTSATLDDSSSTGAACVPGREQCVADVDCTVGTCADCKCRFEYGPCPSAPCDCPPPSNSICFEGGCFCYVPCTLGQDDACPWPPAATAVPVCAEDKVKMGGVCGLTCGITEDCPLGMECVTVPDGLPMWDNSVCVFPF